MQLIKDIIANRRLIASLSKNDFKTKYAGSSFGMIWAFVQPIVTILVYWFVFQVGLRQSSDGDYPYVLWLVSGIVPWFFFADALNGGTSALLEYNYLVKKVVFKINILPVIKVISALFVHAFFVIVTLILVTCYGYFPGLCTIQIVYYTFCAFVLVLGITYFTSAVVVFFRDLTQLINIILQIGVWMTPIMWNLSIIPGPFKWIFKLNPMYYVTNGYRQALLDRVWFWQNWELSLYFWAVIIVLFAVGTRVFKKLQIHFADVL